MKNCVKGLRASFVALLTLLLCLFPSPSFAAGGVELTGGDVIGEKTFSVTGSTEIDAGTNISPVPPLDHVWKLSLHFSKNVSYANAGRDDAFIKQNLSRIKLMTANGEEAEGYHVRAGGTQSERQTIYIDIDKWLKPLTEYRIVIEPGIQAANGEDVSTTRYVVKFKTNAQCENGFTVYQNAMIFVIPAILLAGGITAIIRQRVNRG